MDNMNIGIVGLGLIGGSMAKCITAKTGHTVYGFDKNADVLQNALHDGCIKCILDDESIPLCDVIILCLFPDDAIDFAGQKAHLIKIDCILTDCCGVKGYVAEGILPISQQRGFCYIGGHPMAGLAKVGFEYSNGELFSGASMILTPDDDTPEEQLKKLSEFYTSLGFGQIKITTAQQHDRMIAFTSQLAHVLSNAYVKSDCALEHDGYSAGSFRDLTRVAWLNENMWTELFMENKNALSHEIETLIKNLADVKNALDSGDSEQLRRLLREGREQKERVDRLDRNKDKLYKTV